MVLLSTLIVEKLSDNKFTANLTYTIEKLCEIISPKFIVSNILSNLGGENKKPK
jgi:hypothetical protein